MKSPKETAIELVREACPELIQKTPIKCPDSVLGQCKGSACKWFHEKIEYIDPGLHHWLRLLEEPVDEIYISGTGEVTIVRYGEEEHLCEFSLTTGQPSSPEDYQAIVDICS